MTSLFAILLSLRMLGIPCQIVTVSISAYSDYGITASGALTRPGVAACGPSYPFGTFFLVAGQWFMCLDRGGLVTDGHLDLWMASEDAAWEFGRATRSVIVVRPH